MTKFPMSVSVSTQWFHQNEFQMLSDILVRWEERDNRGRGVHVISAEGLALFLSSLPL